MAENNANNIDGAFEMLLEEVEAEIDFITRIGSQAFENRDFPALPRWRNSAQWARNTMRQDGLLKDDSPHGTWEISDAGRAHLKGAARE